MSSSLPFSRSPSSGGQPPDGLPNIRVGPIPEQKTRLAEARNNQLGYFYTVTTYRDAFCTPFPTNPPITSSTGARGLDTFTSGGRYNPSCTSAQRQTSMAYGGSQKFTSGTLPTAFRPPTGPLVDLVQSGGMGATRSLRPPPGSARDLELWSTSDPRWSVRRERGFGTATPEQLRAMAAETMGICDEGGYQAPSGRSLEIREHIYRAIRGSVLFRPDHVFPGKDVGVPRSALIAVTPESICEACKRLIQREERVVVLNFASPSAPGGGFLNGRRGQEEALARASALYPTIAKHQEMYRFALSNPSPLGSDYMIYSPDVPFFREDNGDLMEEPFLVSVITAAAVQANQCAGRPELEGAIRDTMRMRMRKIIQIAIQYGHRVLLLGAFGCGQFANDPFMVAELEKELLIDEGLVRYFDLVLNPIQDGFRYQNYEAFSQVLGQYGAAGDNK